MKREEIEQLEEENNKNWKKTDILKETGRNMNKRE
jgi:hypothetical protein